MKPCTRYTWHSMQNVLVCGSSMHTPNSSNVRFILHEPWDGLYAIASRLFVHPAHTTPIIIYQRQTAIKSQTNHQIINETKEEEKNEWIFGNLFRAFVDRCIVRTRAHARSHSHSFATVMIRQKRSANTELKLYELCDFHMPDTHFCTK